MQSKHSVWSRGGWLAMMVSLLGAAGCMGTSAPAPVAHSTQWQPLHAFTPKVERLSEVSVPAWTWRVRASDYSLQRLLRRWAQEAGTSLHYDVVEDYSLPQVLADLHAADLVTALRQLEQAYGDQGLRVYAQEQPAAIVVQKKEQHHE